MAAPPAGRRVSTARLLMSCARLAACLAVFTALSSAALPAPLNLAYSLSPVPATRESAASTRVSLRLEGMEAGKAVLLQMPAWSPGDYSVQNHARWVRGLTATAEGGRALAVTRPDRHTWRFDPGGAAFVVVRYTLPNTPPGNFSENVRVDARHAFYSGPAVFVYVVGHKQDPVTLSVRPPPGWSGVVCPLDPAEGAARGDTRFTAPDYDTLADSPVLVGEAVTRSFTVSGVPHTVAYYGEHQGIDPDGPLPRMQRIVSEQARQMGGLPYRRYVFFMDVGGRGGGLEHGSSSRIAWDGYRDHSFDLYVAHELQHAWNVKRIRPRELGPFDYIDPPRTPDLWFAEGVTHYTAVMSLRRSGLWSDADLYASLAASISELQRTPGRLRTTAERAGLDVWQTRSSSGSGGLSYYLKGELIGLCLDLKLRALSEGRASLDGVLRDLMARHAPPRPGYGPDGLREAMVRAGGAAMGPWYDLLVRSAQEIPYEEALEPLGLALARQGDTYRLGADGSASEAAVLLRRDWLTGGSKDAPGR